MKLKYILRDEILYVEENGIYPKSTQTTVYIKGKNYIILEKQKTKENQNTIGIIHIVEDEPLGIYVG